MTTRPTYRATAGSFTARGTLPELVTIATRRRLELVVTDDQGQLVAAVERDGSVLLRAYLEQRRRERR